MAKKEPEHVRGVGDKEERMYEHIKESAKKEGRYKAAEARYTAADQVNLRNLKRWLAKARDIQWDYKNIVRRKGRLERLK